jgi:hypothetical protein
MPKCGSRGAKEAGEQDAGEDIALADELELHSVNADPGRSPTQRSKS